MCLGIPGKVIAVKNKKAKIEQGGHSHWVDISLIEEGVKVGDYLLAYQEAAINKVSHKEAKEILSLIEEGTDA